MKTAFLFPLFMAPLFRVLLCMGLLFMPAAFAEKPPAGVYSPIGKRDPFRVPALDRTGGLGRSLASEESTQKFGIDRLLLRAVLRSGGKAQALFEDPAGNSYVVSEGEILGRERGTVSRILDTEVIVTEKTYNYLGAEVLYEKVLSLSSQDEEGGSRPPKDKPL